MKRLFVVEDMPKYGERHSCYYVVLAENHKDAIEIVKRMTGYTDWYWMATLVDNDEIWQ